jgi:hypothetical protein
MRPGTKWCQCRVSADLRSERRLRRGQLIQLRLQPRHGRGRAAHALRVGRVGGDHAQNGADARHPAAPRRDGC